MKAIFYPQFKEKIKNDSLKNYAQYNPPEDLKSEEYTIHSVSAGSASVNFHIVGSMHEISANLFEITDNRISRYWRIFFTNHQYQINQTCKSYDKLYLAPEGWLQDASYESDRFIYHFFDRDSKTREIYYYYCTLMDYEFPDRNLMYAEKLRDNWVICNQCSEAWQPEPLAKDGIQDGIIQCPVCRTHFNNPYYKEQSVPSVDFTTLLGKIA